MLASIGLGLAWSQLAHAEPAIAPRKTLTLDSARELIAAAQKVARARHTTGAVAVVDEGGNLIALDRIDGTFPAASNIAIGKARTAAQFKKPTRFFEDVIAKGRTAMTALPDFTPLGGGLPLAIDGQVVGAVGVSGAASAKEDEELAAVAAAALPAGAYAGVRLIDKERVSAAFQKGEPLVETADYKVHASHRLRRRQVGGAQRGDRHPLCAVRIRRRSSLAAPSSTPSPSSPARSAAAASRAASGGSSRRATS